VIRFGVSPARPLASLTEGCHRRTSSGRSLIEECVKAIGELVVVPVVQVAVAVQRECNG
jgi:hypothetical protein